MTPPSIYDVDVSGKKVFVRADIDVPIGVENIEVKGPDGETPRFISDDSRLKAIWPTIAYLLSQNCSVVVAGHLGRPGGEKKTELSAKPVAEWLLARVKDDLSVHAGYAVSQQEVVKEMSLAENLAGFAAGERLVVLENLRFDSREEANDEEYAKNLASLAEVYVNESFGESHRAVASIVGVPKILPHYAGLRLVKEVEILGKVLEKPTRPLIVVIGGAKLETKLPIIAKMTDFADRLIVGGRLLAEVKEKLPKVLYLALTADQKDTTLESIDQTQIIISYAATIVWNGPFGGIEDYTYQVGTRRLAELIVNAPNAYKIVGGGDSIAFLNKLGMTEKFDWVSVGGGAMLAFLAGESLPGIEALIK